MCVCVCVRQFSQSTLEGPLGRGGQACRLGGGRKSCERKKASRVRDYPSQGGIEPDGRHCASLCRRFIIFRAVPDAGIASVAVVRVDLNAKHGLLLGSRQKGKKGKDLAGRGRKSRYWMVFRNRASAGPWERKLQTPTLRRNLRGACHAPGQGPGQAQVRPGGRRRRAPRRQNSERETR